MNSHIFHIATATTAFWLLAAPCLAQQTPAQMKESKLAPGYTIPTVDISAEQSRQVVVDREPGPREGGRESFSGRRSNVKFKIELCAA